MFTRSIRYPLWSRSYPTAASDHVQISALSRALRINVKVAYLDGRGDAEKVDFVELQNVEEGYNGMRDVVLLYRYVLPISCT